MFLELVSINRPYAMFLNSKNNKEKLNFHLNKFKDLGISYFNI